MNRQEIELYSGHAAGVRIALSTDERTWCTIDELLARPGIFPYQPGNPDSTPEGRLLWARQAKDHGALFVCTQRTEQGFGIAWAASPPPKEYRHISKLWRDYK